MCLWMGDWEANVQNSMDYFFPLEGLEWIQREAYFTFPLIISGFSGNTMEVNGTGLGSSVLIEYTIQQLQSTPVDKL